MTFEAAVFAAFLAGFLGSSHCIGMCGAIVVLFEGGPESTKVPGAWLRRLSYNLGRATFYALLGAIAAIGGAVLTKTVGVSQGLTLLRWLAALLVIAIGLNLLFDWRVTRFLESAGSGLWRKLSRYGKSVLPATTVPRALGAGFIWGALPCGLVYSAVALAATTANPASGVGVMFAFWLGTLPVLLFIGESAQRLNRLKSNRAFRRIAGIIVILVGLAALIPMGQSSKNHKHQAAAIDVHVLEEKA
ncbi:MAG: sulfite exporter TauE/SafE family protein [Woeseiaceae bacterium]